MIRQLPLHCPPTSGADEGGDQGAWAWPVDVLDLDTFVCSAHGNTCMCRRCILSYLKLQCM